MSTTKLKEAFGLELPAWRSQVDAMLAEVKKG